jgi:HD-like signal output (HDOD) protein
MPSSDNAALKPAITAQDAENQINAAEFDAVLKSVSIPPRPLVVQQLQAEMAKAEPDLKKAAGIVVQDVGLTVAVLKTVNSPVYGLTRKVETVEQAVGILGLKRLSTLVTALAMRSLMKGDSRMLERFYDTSTKRAYAMTRMARSTRAVDTDLAQTFGLFCDVGIPLLINRFPNYLETLKVANVDAERSFTQIKQAAHQTDHALVGAMMTRSWGLSPTVSLAIRLHHDYAVFTDPKVPRDVARLIALGLMAEVAIQRFARLHSTVEWFKGGDYVAGALVLAPAEIEDWIEQLIEDFASGLD